MKIYVDTSVINGLFADDALAIQSATLDFIALVRRSHYHLYVSDLVISEIEQTNIKHKVMAAQYIPDALHIALATTHKIPILVSWNFKHMVRHHTRVLVNQVNEKLGYAPIDICSPQEV